MPGRNFTLFFYSFFFYCSILDGSIQISIDTKEGLTRNSPKKKKNRLKHATILGLPTFVKLNIVKLNMLQLGNLRPHQAWPCPETTPGTGLRMRAPTPGQNLNKSGKYPRFGPFLIWAHVWFYCMATDGILGFGSLWPGTHILILH